MEFAIYYTVGAVALYFLADWILNYIEQKRGEPFKHRSIIYFIIVFALALGLMEIINPSPAPQPAAMQGQGLK